MKQRCCNPRNKQFADYGGRGIRVCKRWDKFENFLADMGERPSSLSLDRKNNDGNYSKRNCRWATPTEQANNSRQVRLLTHEGETKRLTDWAQEYGLAVPTLSNRISRRGWPDAITSVRKWTRKQKASLT